MIPRHIGSAIREALADTPVVLLVGARQTGKTTLARDLASGPWGGRYLTLDDASVLAATRSDPQGFVAGLSGAVVLDEIQKAPDLLPAIKGSVDRDRRPGRFLLTGSANVLLLPRVSESLAGRMEVLTLHPLSQGERGGVREGFLDAALQGRRPSVGTAAPEDDVVERVLAGGFPEAVGRAGARRRAWFASYVTTVLTRDVRDLSNVDGLVHLPRLLALLASRSAGLLNTSDVSRAIGLPLSTLVRYLSLLETTFLVSRLPAWTRGREARLVKAPKVHLADSGLLAALLRVDAAAIRDDRTLLGPLLETFVAGELRRQTTWSERRPELLHFRTHAQREVDLVVEDAAGHVVGLEVKASASVGPTDFAGLRALAEAAGRRFVQGAVLYLGTEVVPFDRHLSAWPVSSLWTLGARR